jgi:hypothetical protein
MLYSWINFPMKHAYLRLPLAAVMLNLVWLLGVSARAQTASDAQSWNEFRIYLTRKQFTAVGFLSLRSEEDFSHLYERHMELSLQRGLLRNLNGALAYRFVTSRPERGRLNHENRLSVDVIPALPLPENIILTDRNRLEFRWLNGVPSQRYRNRLMLRRVFPRARGTAPYLAGEAFYDSRFGHWSRWRAQAGVTFPVVRHLELETAYWLQKDIHPRGVRWNILYTSFHLRF